MEEASRLFWQLSRKLSHVYTPLSRNSFPYPKTTRPAGEAGPVVKCRLFSKIVKWNVR
jgi:hypothetical protein